MKTCRQGATWEALITISLGLRLQKKKMLNEEQENKKMPE